MCGCKIVHARIDTVNLGYMTYDDLVTRQFVVANRTFHDLMLHRQRMSEMQFVSWCICMMQIVSATSLFLCVCFVEICYTCLD